MAEKVWVFAYDISSNKRRRKLANLLEDVAVRVQYSLFEARLSRTQLENTIKAIKAIIFPEDKVRIYSLDQVSVEESISFGGTPMPEKTDFWLL